MYRNVSVKDRHYLSSWFSCGFSLLENRKDSFQGEKIIKLDDIK